MAAIAGLLIVYTVSDLADGLIPRTLQDRFDLDGEATIPSWFSGMLLMAVAVCAFIIHSVRYRLGGSLPTRFFWLVFGAFYMFMSADEVAELHEIIDAATSVKWIFVYAPVGGVFFLYVAWYFLVERRAIGAVAGLILGGLLLFAVGGLFAEAVDHFFYPLPDMLQLVEIVVEEGLEMVGTALVLVGCLKELRASVPVGTSNG
jgi:hypothetical protein